MARQYLEALKIKVVGYWKWHRQSPGSEGLRVLVEKPTQSRPQCAWVQFQREIELDPWGRSYRYQEQDGRVTISSTGRNVADPSDDVSISFELQ